MNEIANIFMGILSSFDAEQSVNVDVNNRSRLHVSDCSIDRFKDIVNFFKSSNLATLLFVFVCFLNFETKVCSEHNIVTYFFCP